MTRLSQGDHSQLSRAEAGEDATTEPMDRQATATMLARSLRIYSLFLNRRTAELPPDTWHPWGRRMTRFIGPGGQAVRFTGRYGVTKTACDLRLFAPHAPQLVDLGLEVCDASGEVGVSPLLRLVEASHLGLLALGVGQRSLGQATRQL